MIDSFDVGYEKATSFARANLHPERWSPRLVPVLELLKRIRAFQRYNEPSSWLYLITSVPVLRKKLTFVQLEGPIPVGFNASRLSSPHWSIPPAFARVPMFTHLVSAQLFRTHFARFADLVQLLRHFARAEQLTFADVTWGDADAPVLWPTRTTKERVETPPRRAYAANCTNNVLMAMAAHYLDSGLPLRTALASEQQKVQQLAQISYEYTTDSDVYCSAYHLLMGSVGETLTTHSATVFFIPNYSPRALACRMQPTYTPHALASRRCPPPLPTCGKV